MSGERRKGRMLVLGSVFLLLGLSILMVFSTTSVKSENGAPSLGMLKKHLFQIILGLFVFWFSFRVSLERICRIAPFFLLFTLGALAFVLIPGLGTSAGGAQRWFSVGPLRIQPGELAKLAVILYMATYVGRHHQKMTTFVSGALIPLGLVGCFGALLLLQPDFGSTVIIFTVVLLQLLLVSSLKHLLGLGAVGLIGVVSLIAISPYRFRRFQSFLNPMADASASGYQLVQSLIAVGSGGVFGLGLGAGKQKLFYLPAAHTDFIYAVIAEELGLVGAGFVLLLFLVIAVAGYASAIRLAENPLKSSLTVGCTSLIVVPAVLNMGVVLGLLPTKGLVLPFVSYGGTAMLTNFAILGVLVKLLGEDDA